MPWLQPIRLLGRLLFLARGMNPWMKGISPGRRGARAPLLERAVRFPSLLQVPLQRQPQAALGYRLAQGILAVPAGWVLFVLLSCVTLSG
jgi:hypothetical protein